MNRFYWKVSLTTLQSLVFIEESAYSTPSCFADVKAEAHVLNESDMHTKTDNQIKERERQSKNISPNLGILTPLHSRFSIGTTGARKEEGSENPCNVGQFGKEVADAQVFKTQSLEIQGHKSNTIPLLPSQKNRHGLFGTQTPGKNLKLIVPQPKKPTTNNEIMNPWKPMNQTLPLLHSSKWATRFSNTPLPKENERGTPMVLCPITPTGNELTNTQESKEGLTSLTHSSTNHYLPQSIDSKRSLSPSLTVVGQWNGISGSLLRPELPSTRRTSRMPLWLSPANSALKILLSMQENVLKAKDSLEFMAIFSAQGKTELLVLSAVSSGVMGSIAQVLGSPFNFGDILEVSLGDKSGSVIAAALARSLSPETVVSVISPLHSELSLPKVAQLFESSLLFTKSIVKTVFDEKLGKSPQFDFAPYSAIQSNKFSDSSQLFIALQRLLGDNAESISKSKTSFFPLNSRSINNNDLTSQVGTVFLETLNGEATSSSSSLNEELQKFLDNFKDIPGEYATYFSNFQKTAGVSQQLEPSQTPDEFIRSIEFNSSKKSTLIFNLLVKQGSGFAFSIKPQFSSNSVNQERLQLDFQAFIPVEAYEESKISADTTVTEITKLTMEYFSRAIDHDQKLERSRKRTISPAPAAVEGETNSIWSPTRSLSTLWSLSPASSPVPSSSPLPPPLIGSSGLDGGNAEEVLRQLLELIKGYISYR